MFDLTFIIFILSSIPVFFVFWIAGRFKNELVADSSFGLRGDDNLSCLRGWRLSWSPFTIQYICSIIFIMINGVYF